MCFVCVCVVCVVCVGVARGEVRGEKKHLVQGLMDHDDGIWVLF